MSRISIDFSSRSFIVHFRPDTQEETCKNWNDNTSHQVDLAFNLFFMVFFIIRVSCSFHFRCMTVLRLLSQFIASNDKLACCLDIHSFVDYFTIPPIFVGIYLNRQWLGECLYLLRGSIACLTTPSRFAFPQGSPTDGIPRHFTILESAPYEQRNSSGSSVHNFHEHLASSGRIRSPCETFYHKNHPG